MTFSTYDPGEFYDELYEGIGRPRRGSALLLRKFASLPDGELRKRQQAAERVILNMGMTFGVYGSDAEQEKIFPFDIVPRIVTALDWSHIESGLQQRIRALNCFLDDIISCPKYSQGRSDSRRIDLLRQGFSTGLHGTESASGHMVPHRWDRSGTHQ